MALAPIPLVSGMTRVSRAYLINHDTDVETEVGLRSAEVTIDRRAESRRVVSASLTGDIDPDLLTAPHRLRIRSGYRVGGVEYLADLAHVRLGRRDRVPLGPRDVSGVSLEALVRSARFAAPRRVEGSAVTAMSSLIAEAVPWATVTVATARDLALAAGGVVYDRERLEAVVGRELSLATAVGVDVYCDGSGAFIIGDIPSLDATPWDTTGLASSWRESLDPSTVTNSWVVSTDHPDVDPTRAVVDDDYPYSPTRVARWGLSRNFLSSPVLNGPDACERAARTLLDGSRGTRVDLEITTPPNPWADVTEPIVAQTDSGRAVFLLDRIVHRISDNLDEQLTMTATARLVSAA